MYMTTQSVAEVGQWAAVRRLTPATHDGVCWSIKILARRTGIIAAVYSDADGAVSRPTGCWGCFGTFLWCGWERFGIQLEDRILVTLELLCMFLAIGEVYCHRIVKYLLIDDFKEKSITRCTNYEGCQNSNVLEISFCRKGCENPPALWLALLVNVENANLIDGISRE